MALEISKVADGSVIPALLEGGRVAKAKAGTVPWQLVIPCAEGTLTVTGGFRYQDDKNKDAGMFRRIKARFVPKDAPQHAAFHLAQIETLGKMGVGFAQGVLAEVEKATEPVFKALAEVYKNAPQDAVKMADADLKARAARG